MAKRTNKWTEDKIARYYPRDVVVVNYQTISRG